MIKENIKIKWIKNYNSIKKGPVIFFGNEFFDAIPVKQFTVKNKKFLETGTSNLLFIKNNRVYSPKNNFYSGITFKFFCKKIKINLRDIYLKNINSFDEILLIGSGKAVTSVLRIDELKWKRKSLNFFNKLNKIYQKKINYA